MRERLGFVARVEGVRGAATNRQRTSLELSYFLLAAYETTLRLSCSHPTICHHSEPLMMLKPRTTEY